MQSESIKSLLADFAKAQSEFPTLPKDKTGYGYKYTDLDTVICTVRPILAKHNLGFMQSLTTLENGKSGIATRLFHATGEWIEDKVALPDVAMAKTNAAQNMGASITYMKRYALCAMLGISSDEDVDGNPDMGKSAPTNNAKPTGPMGGPDTPEQRKTINGLIATKYSDGTKIFSKAEIDGLLKLRETHTAGEVISNLKKEIEERLAKASAKASETTPEKFPEDIPYEENSEKMPDDKDIIF